MTSRTLHCKGINLDFVTKGIIALLALVLALHAGFGCGVKQAGATIEAPCCGGNCPVPSVGGDAACCPAQNSGARAHAVSPKSSVPSFQPLADSIRSHVMMPALTGIEHASAFKDSPSGASKLALLCSLQI